MNLYIPIDQRKIVIGDKIRVTFNDKATHDITVCQTTDDRITGIVIGDSDIGRKSYGRKGFNFLLISPDMDNHIKELTTL